MPRTAAGRRRYLTLGIDVSGWKCVVVGGGPIGTRKALKLAGGGARVTVVAPALGARLRAAAAAGKLAWRRARYAPACLAGARLAVAATDDPALNARIARDAEARGALCCVASPGRLSRVIFTAACERGGVAVAVHTHGRRCGLARRVRDAVRTLLRRRERTAR